MAFVVCQLMSPAQGALPRWNDDIVPAASVTRANACTAGVQRRRRRRPPPLPVGQERPATEATVPPAVGQQLVDPLDDWLPALAGAVVAAAVAEAAIIKWSTDHQLVTFGSGAVERSGGTALADPVRRHCAAGESTRT